MGPSTPRHPRKCWHYLLGKTPVVFDSSKSVYACRPCSVTVSPGEVRRKGILGDVWESLTIMKKSLRYYMGTNMGYLSLRVQGYLYESRRKRSRETSPQVPTPYSSTFAILQEATWNEGRDLQAVFPTGSFILCMPLPFLYIRAISVFRLAKRREQGTEAWQMVF